MVVLSTLSGVLAAVAGMIFHHGLVLTGHVDPGGRATGHNQTFVWTNAVIMGDNSGSLSNNSISTGSLSNSYTGGPCRPSKPNIGIFSDATNSGAGSDLAAASDRADSHTGSDPAAASDTASDPAATSDTASDPAAASDVTNSLSKPVACQSAPTSAHRTPRARATSQTATCCGFGRLLNPFGDGWKIGREIGKVGQAVIHVAHDTEEAIAAVSQGDCESEDEALDEGSTAHQEGVTAKQNAQDEASDEAAADQPKADASQHHWQTGHETHAWLMSQRLEAPYRLSQPASLPDLGSQVAETTEHLLAELASSASRLEALEHAMGHVYAETISSFHTMTSRIDELHGLYHSSGPAPVSTGVVAIQIEEPVTEAVPEVVAQQNDLDNDSQNGAMGDGGRTETWHPQHHMIASDDEVDESDDLEFLPFAQSNLRVAEIRPSDLAPVNLRMSADVSETRV